MEEETLVLDPLIDYHAIPGLSSEARERLSTTRPTSIVRFIELLY
jgi:tRNA uridine 5-carboxymethylaminomethyl modification enzyme